MVKFLAFLLFPATVHAAKIGELTDTAFGEQIVRFFAFGDASVVMSLAGCVLLGIVLSWLGSFMVLRKMSLMGDTLGHAVLPGICLAFMITGTKSFLPTLAGAVLSGLAGVFLIQIIVRYSRIKTDAAMGMILSSFFGLGIVLLTMIQQGGNGNQSGLDKFLFGQAAALSSADVWALLIVTVVTGLLLLLTLKELTVTGFDAGFAASIGIPVGFFQMLLLVLTAIAVVASIQAVGVVLVSAMLIIPPATSFLFVKQVRTLLWTSALLGATAGFLGAFFSFLGPSLPTGPFMVVSAAFFFAAVFFFGPRHGVLFQLIRRRQRRVRTERENHLKSIYHLLEQQQFQPDWLAVQSLAAFRSETAREIEKHLTDLQRRGWVLRKDREWFSLTHEGGEKAKKLIRKHRLWELFLVEETHLPADHVHADAEELEHFLSEEVLKVLEEKLDGKRLDPHGKPIP